MVTKILLFLVGSIVSPAIGLAQISSAPTPMTSMSAEVAPTSMQQVMRVNTVSQSVDGVQPQQKMMQGAPAQALPAMPTKIAPATSAQPMPATTAGSSTAKCGVNSFAVENDCGAGAFKNAEVQCYDGYQINLGEETSCKSAETWKQYAHDACVNRCGGAKPINAISQPMPTASQQTMSATRQEYPLQTPQSIKPVSVCQMSDNLMEEYSKLTSELQNSTGDAEKTAAIHQKIISLKQEIERQRQTCATAPNQMPTVIAQPAQIAPTASTVSQSENMPMAVSINRCNEMTQWENKIAYYQKLSGLSDADLKTQGFSRDEIKNILQELYIGAQKVKAQCGAQGGTGSAATPAVGALPITETVMPVAVDSGQEITSYYKTKLEKVAGAKDTAKQIEDLKQLRSEIDGLISNLIKGRKELEVSELGTLVNEVKISKGEIKADNVTIKTTDKKMLTNVGNRPVSIEPNAERVIMMDNGMEVKTDAAIVIKDNTLTANGAAVTMPASAVAEKLGIVPAATDLKVENNQAIYQMNTGEKRKLFGFIPMTVSNTITANAENGAVIRQDLPWYGFLTTK